jgi:hypothetical protein
LKALFYVPLTIQYILLIFVRFVSPSLLKFTRQNKQGSAVVLLREKRADGMNNFGKGGGIFRTDYIYFTVFVRNTAYLAYLLFKAFRFRNEYNSFDFFKSAPQKDVFRSLLLTSLYFSEATSIKLVHISNNNFHSRDLSILLVKSVEGARLLNLGFFAIFFYFLRVEQIAKKCLEKPLKYKLFKT